MKKGINIILIIIVIAIYAKAFWPNNPISIQNPSNHINSNTEQNISIRSDKNIPLNLDFNDPFLKKRYTKKKVSIPSKKPTKSTHKRQVIEEASPPPDITYLGRIHNPSTGISKGLIQFNKKELIIELNDSISGYQIKKIDKNTITIKSKNQHVTIKKI